MVEQVTKYILTFHEYDLGWFILVYILLVGTILFLKRNKERIIKELSNAILVSFSILIAIFIGYRFFPNDNGLFNKLLSGEIIVGITVAAPTLYTWYKKEKEIYQYQLYTELKKDYIDWYEDFYKGEIDSVLAIVKLNQILDRYGEFCKKSKNTDMVPIDISSLYVTIQEKFAKDSIEKQKMKDTEISKLYREWRKINDKIINDIPSKQYYDHYKIIYAIDFNKQNNIFTSNTYTNRPIAPTTKKMKTN